MKRQNEEQKSGEDMAERRNYPTSMDSITRWHEGEGMRKMKEASKPSDWEYRKETTKEVTTLGVWDDTGEQVGRKEERSEMMFSFFLSFLFF